MNKDIVELELTHEECVYLYDKLAAEAEVITNDDDIILLDSILDKLEEYAQSDEEE
jgi:hypothetical protein